jgi:phenylacetate-CoA ligase
VSQSSGSTGKPFFWPRGSYQAFEGAFQFEHLLTTLFGIDKKSTLLVDCFSMGSYVAGVYVFTCVKLLALKGYKLTIVTPGLNYQEIYRMLKKLANNYEQIILCGYPPFLKDVVDLRNKFKFNFKKYDVKFFFASEFFSESWRERVLTEIGKSGDFRASTNIYGTADSAIFSFETPMSILVRKIVEDKVTVGRELFKSNLMPTLTQYNPVMTFYEEVDNELTLTTNAGLPLIRYNLRDRGGILTLNEIVKDLGENKINMKSQIKKHISTDGFNNLPFVFLTSRTDGAVSFYAILIYPEYIAGGLETVGLRKKLSGKFSLVTKADKDQNPMLVVHVELNPGVRASEKLREEVRASVIGNLRIRCLEYSFLEKSIGRKAVPKVVLHKKGRSKYFEVGVKQKWIIN